MLSFFKRKHSDDELKRTGEDSVVSADEVGEGVGHEVETELIETTLSIHPQWELPKEQLYVYQFLNNDCKPLKKNQLGISGIEWEEEQGGVRVSAFIRNSSDEAIELEWQTLVMFDAEGKPLARRKFHLGIIGKLMAESSRPWHFFFKESDLLADVDTFPKEGWRLAFEIRNIAEEHTLDLSADWAQTLLPEDQENLHKLVDQLPKLSPGELNLFGVDATQDPHGRIHVFCLFRNGSDSDVRIDRVPLMFKDATDKVITQADFELGDFIVKPNTSKPWRFNFPEQIDRELDLTTWEVQLLTQ